MARVNNAEPEAVILRTTADVVSHALTQLDVCAQTWTEYKPAAATMREFVERMVVHAREYGYTEKRGRV